MKMIIKIFLLIACIFVFIFSGYKIYTYVVEEKANKEINNSLVEKGVTIINTTSNNENKNEIEDNNKDEEKLPINVNFSVLKRECKDIVGWIYMPDTPINYPVVQSEDNLYYVRRLIDGSYNNAGTIFMDFRNDSDLSNKNTIIYGHNMKNDKMFGTLEKYKKQEYYDTHKIMYYFAPEKNYKIELFAGCNITVESSIYDLPTNISNYEKFKQKSDFKSDVILTNEDKIITLSTCSYNYDGARYIVMGVLREIVN